MRNERSNVRVRPQAVRVDAYTRVCLTAIAVLLTVVILGLWADGVPTAGELRAADKFLDSAAQRKAIMEQQKQTNAKLDVLIGLFKDGQAKVRLVPEGPVQAGGGQVAPQKSK